MNTKEYIESGMLEAYALGSLPPNEMEEVAANVARYAELAHELELIENTLAQYSSSIAKDPPAGMHSKIWDAIQVGKTKPDGLDAEPTPPRVIPFQPAYQKPAQWKYAALWLGLAGSIALNMAMWNNNKDAVTATAAVKERMDSVTRQQQQMALLIDEYQKAKAMMADTAMQTIVMHTMQKGHAMTATLYWSKSKGTAYVSADGLPTPPPGMQYQLWALQGGKPVDMGVLANNMANTPSIQRATKTVMSGEAFAISLEKEGGSPVPTMENIYVLGKA